MRHRCEKSNPLSTGRVDTGVACCGGTLVSLVTHQPDARIGQGFDRAFQIIGRCIVDDDQFQIAVGLCEHAGHCRPYRRRAVVYRDHNRDLGHGFENPEPSMQLAQDHRRETPRHTAMAESALLAIASQNAVE